MPQFVALSRNHHAGKRWLRHASYRFAAQDALIPLVAQELPKAIMSLPVGFIAAGEGFVPVAVQGLTPGQNLFVAPDGRWLAAYTPAAYRGYPFRLARAENGQQVLCFDQESGLISDGAQGEPLFDEAGNPSKGVTEVMNFLTQVQTNRELTDRVCALLQQHGLIQPWPLKVQEAGGERMVEGLYRIDEAALNALPADVFSALRDGGALPLATASCCPCSTWPGWRPSPRPMLRPKPRPPSPCRKPLPVTWTWSFSTRAAPSASAIYSEATRH